MATLRDTSLGSYLDDVSGSSPTPGGGSVAAVVAALAAALGSMVTALAARKNENESIRILAEKCRAYRETFLQLGTEDQAAFEAVMAALKLSKEDSARPAQVEATVQRAARAPLAVAQSCFDFLVDLESLTTQASRHAISDVGAAAHFALAALRASLLNVHINCTFMKDQATAAAFEAAASELEAKGAARSQRIVDQVLARIRG
ncbi:cyclodeaminase/cyclohydrolase family protein [Candidatus Bipolaricaulota bacterium]|nr:cyclodeaminase/cyclohydrolase family protein [Candidatus Bipolaricaulota bacterium]